LTVETRDMTGADLEGGLRLSRASGWNQTLEDWRLLLSLGPGLFRVAVEEGEIVASGGAVRYGDDLAWICMILVDPPKRGRGLGTLIFDEVLERARACVRGGSLRAVGLDATPAGHGIYAQQGFQDEGGIVRMRADAPGGAALESRVREPGAIRGLTAVRLPLDANIQDLTPGRKRNGINVSDSEVKIQDLTPGDLPAVVARDREVFGGDRGAVLRWALASAPDLAWIGEGRGGPAYCFGRHGDHSDQVGPVVADDPATAAGLVRACLAVPRSRPLLVDARVERGWLAALGEMGFREQRPFTRMYLGEARPAAQPGVELAVFGPEFG
jgi:GNAT superfamily N-acetyltransferase